MIQTSKNLRQVLNYNEKKVQRNRAQLIHAANFLQEKDGMKFYEKMQRFQKLSELNTRSKVNVLHVSLNFHRSEKIENQKVLAIVEGYMEKIGFSNQPWLVYQHFDAGHPHVHIVSTLIKQNGQRIRTQNLGKNQSARACRELEKEFRLVSAVTKNRKLDNVLASVDAQKIIYGKSEIKNSMRNILVHVINEYKYTSLPELNALLKQYSMMADRGGVGSRIHKNGGLVYKAIDENGNAVGVPIRASDFFNKPTLKNLEKKFEANKELRKKFIAGIKARIDWTLLGEPGSLYGFANELEKEDIRLVIRQNEQGIIYGLTYVDFKTKTVINGSDLGKLYSAKGVLERFAPSNAGKIEKQVDKTQNISEREQDKTKIEFAIDENSFSVSHLPFSELISDLIKPDPQDDELPYELRKKKRKRRK